MKVFIKDDDKPTGIEFTTSDDRPKVINGPESFLTIISRDSSDNSESLMYPHGYELTHAEATELYVMLGQALEGEEEEE